MMVEEVLHGNIEVDGVNIDAMIIEKGHFVVGSNALFEQSVSHNKLYKTMYYEKHAAHNPMNGMVHFHIYQENIKDSLYAFNIDGSLHDKSSPTENSLSKGMVQALHRLGVDVSKISPQFLKSGAISWIQNSIRAEEIN